MGQTSSTPGQPLVRQMPFLPVAVLTMTMFAFAMWANLSFALTRPSDLRFIPPFQPLVNSNENRTLAAEYSNIAEAVVAGKGFANPFTYPTGPTSWQPPVYPLLLAGVFWMCSGERDDVMGVIIFLQTLTLIGTGLLVVNLSLQTTNRLGYAVPLLMFLAVVFWNFFRCFQKNNDFWIVLLALDLLVAGFCWFRPLLSRQKAISWGLFGGICAMINPGLGLGWGILTLATALREKIWRRFGLTIVCAVLMLTPWTVRNYLVFGRFIPLKSNLAFELYQSQCLQPEGLLASSNNHPFSRNNREAKEFLALGETAFLDRKWEQFCDSVVADPLDFTDRVANRFLSATVWFVPYSGNGEPLSLPLKRLTHPLPFLAMLFLVFSSFSRPLLPEQRVVIALYLLYLFPYVLVSYYDRYGGPLLGLKVLLVVWAIERVVTMRKGYELLR